MTPWARIGDVFEVKTPKGFGYFQYTHDHKGLGKLVRVFPGLYKARPNDMSTVLRQRELYFTFYPLNAAIKRRIVTRVSREEIPETAREFPVMRKRNGQKADGTWVWLIGNGLHMSSLEEMSRLQKVTTLTDAQRKLSIQSIWGPEFMPEQLARGWTPERDEELERAALLADP